MASYTTKLKSQRPILPVKALSSRPLLICVSLLLIVACGDTRSATPYDEALDPFDQLARATIEAENNDRFLLLLFGANWCPDCRNLDHFMSEDPVKAIVDRNFVVLKVDIGNWDRNLDFLAMWESPIASGIPAAVVATPEYDILFATTAGELANARRLGADDLAEFFSNLGKRLRTRRR